MRLVPHLIVLSLGAPLLACSSTAATTTTITRPELVAVSPDDFLGSHECVVAGPDGGLGPGLVGSYVATLFDVTPASDGGLLEDGFPLPSSPATSCEFPVTFSFVLPTHRYSAEIDAYDRLPQDLDAGTDLDADDPDAGPDPKLLRIKALTLGGRIQIDGNGVRVAPHWTAHCGGFPTTSDAGVPPDAGNGTDSGAAGDAGDAPDTSLPGVVSYDTLTTSVHDCHGGLK